MTDFRGTRWSVLYASGGRWRHARRLSWAEVLALASAPGVEIEHIRPEQP